MYAATRGSNVKWGGTDFKWGGRAPLATPLATTLRNRHNLEVPCEHSKRVSTKPGSEKQSSNPRKNENTVLRNASYARTHVCRLETGSRVLCACSSVLFQFPVEIGLMRIFCM